MCIRDSFYTGGEAYCQPNIRYRTHQWQFRDDDTRFAGREVLVECPAPSGVDTTGRIRTIRLANGRSFTWFVDPDFRPVRRVDVSFAGLPEQTAAGDTLRLDLTLSNPYPYDIPIDGTRYGRVRHPAGAGGCALRCRFRAGPRRLYQLV